MTSRIFVRLASSAAIKTKVPGRRSYSVGNRSVSNKQSGSASNKAPPPSSSTPVDVPGLSAAVYQLPAEPVGPGASKDGEYKNPEYFTYHNTSYFEAEIEMLKYRLPQPSNHSK